MNLSSYLRLLPNGSQAVTSASFITPQSSSIFAAKCAKCGENIEQQAKFCGQCGEVMVQPRTTQRTPQATRCTNETPTFARASFADITPKVKAEINQIVSALFRERCILILNTCILLGVNLFGFSLSLKAYSEFNGDEMAKLIIAFTPFLFVNCVGCVAMIPIRGTKREIYRLQQRLQFLRAQMDFNHLMRS